MSLTRDRAVGIVVTAFLLGLAAYLSVVVVEPPGGVLVVEVDGGWSLATGWAADWPWRDVAAYPGVDETTVILRGVDGRDEGGEATLRLRYTTSPRGLARGRGIFGELHPHLPRIAALVVGRLILFTRPLEELYHRERPAARDRLERSLGPLLALGGWRLDEARIVEVSPDEATRSRWSVDGRGPYQHRSVLFVNLGALDFRLLEQLIDDDSLPLIGGLLNNGVLFRFDLPLGVFCEPLQRELGFGVGPRGLSNPEGPTTDRREYTPQPLTRLPLLQQSPSLWSAYERLVDDLRFAGELLTAGGGAVWLSTSLFQDYARRFQPALQRYQTLRYHRRFQTTPSHSLLEAAGAVDYGKLMESLLIELDRHLAALCHAVPHMTLVLVAPAGYGERFPLKPDREGWGPTDSGWTILAGPHIRPSGEIDGHWLELRAAIRALVYGEPARSRLLEPAFSATLSSDRLLDTPQAGR